MNIVLETLKIYQDNHYINDLYRSVKNIKQNVKIKRKHNESIIPYVKLLVYISISKLLVLINLFNKKKISDDKIIAFTRVRRTELRLNSISDNFDYISDDVKNYDFSIYKLGKRVERISYILGEFDKDCIKAMIELDSIIRTNDLNRFRKQILFEFAAKIPHTEYYRKSIDMYLKSYNLDTVYTGQMYDRFALIESKIAKTHSLKLICIPHGIETAELMPVGYVGDVFYATSFEMAERLNELYRTNKYSYDEKIVTSMFRIRNNSKRNQEKRRVVFFTQDIKVDESINVIRKIAEYLDSSNEKLFLKVHPNDNRKRYMGYNIDFIEDFSDAILNNICISLVSTTLIEAIYNNSISISIAKLVYNDLKLEDIFYFLNDSRILKPLNDIELINMIKNNYEQ